MATGNVIQLPNVRLSFPRLVQARAFEEGQEPRYEASFLLDPSNSRHKDRIELVQKEGERLVKEVCKGKVPSDVKYCYGPGSEKEYDGYEDRWFLAANKKSKDGRVTIVDRAGNPVHGPDDDQFPYPGCFVDATISLWSQNGQYGRRVNANLRAIRFRADGEAFSSIKPVDVESEFEDFDESEFGDFNEGDPLET